MTGHDMVECADDLVRAAVAFRKEGVELIEQEYSTGAVPEGN